MDDMVFGHTGNGGADDNARAQATTESDLTDLTHETESVIDYATEWLFVSELGADLEDAPKLGSDAGRLAVIEAYASAAVQGLDVVDGREAHATRRLLLAIRRIASARGAA